MEYDESKIIKFIPNYPKGASIEISFLNDDDIDFRSVFSNLNCLYEEAKNTAPEISIMALHDKPENSNSVFIIKSEVVTEITIVGDSKWFESIFKSVVIDAVNGVVYFYFKQNDEDVVAYSEITSFSILK